jgi:hypothetical protein
MPIPENFELPVVNRDPRKGLPRGRSFGPDNPPPGKGRPKGSINKATRDLKNGILTAAENLGRDGHGERGLVGFLEYLGLYHTKAFAHLLGKLLPFNLNATSVSTSASAVNIISVPVDHYLSAEDIAKMSPRLEIEHELQPEPESVEGPVAIAMEAEPVEPEPEPVIAALIEPEPVNDTMFSRAALRPPRKPSWG